MTRAISGPHAGHHAPITSARRSPLWGPHRRFVFHRAMGYFLEDPRACARPGSNVIAELIYGWGNEEWSALDEFLIGSIGHALTTSGPILECGSGLSTVLVGAVAKMRGLEHWSLEHDPEWAERAQESLDRYGLESKLHVHALRSYGDFCWYDPPLEEMPRDFSLVICDGPPGDTLGGRYGLVPVLHDRLPPSCVILLDDAGREAEQDIARRWALDLGASLEFSGSAEPYVAMKVGERRTQARTPSPAP